MENSWLRDALKQAGLEQVADNIGSCLIHAMTRGHGRTLTQADIRAIKGIVTIMEELREWCHD